MKNTSQRVGAIVQGKPLTSSPGSHLIGQSLVRADEFFSGVQVLATTRFGGSSAAPFDTLNLGAHVGDDPRHVQLNRERLQSVLPEVPVWLNQVHGIHVFEADHACNADSALTPVTADAATTSRQNQVLAILTADCMPVVLVATNQNLLGVAHAGWRGLADGVLRQTVQTMQKRSTVPLEFRAWIGPCIGPQAFQVGAEVRERFLELDSGLSRFFTMDASMRGKWLADLPGIARWQLVGAGASWVQWCGLCTVTDEQKRFFSYRRDGPTGRMATLAWLKT